jgi:hypothetical protein
MKQMKLIVKFWSTVLLSILLSTDGSLQQVSLSQPPLNGSTTGRSIKKESFSQISHSTHLKLEGLVPSNLYMKVVAGSGAVDEYAGDLGPATSASISAWIPWVDAGGNMFIPDGINHCVRRVSNVGAINTFAGSFASSSTIGASGTLTAVMFLGLILWLASQMAPQFI